MTDWEKAQLKQWNKFNTDGTEYEEEDEEEEEDDDYAPIQATSWGSQTVGKDGSTNVSLTANGWASLMDPDFKVTNNGVGSGNLHRKGLHYIPVDEKYIVNQRLGKPMPKGGLGGLGKKKKYPFTRPPPPSLTPTPTPATKKYTPFVPPPSTTRSQRKQIVTGPWASGQLSDTPFWETPTSTTNGKYTHTSINNYPSHANNYKPSINHHQLPTNNYPSANSFPHTENGTEASKYASPLPAAIPITSRVPAINFDIELSPGVHAKLSVYEDDVPEDVVNQFEKKHHLFISETAKRVFADKVKNLLVVYRST